MIAETVSSEVGFGEHSTFVLTWNGKLKNTCEK